MFQVIIASYIILIIAMIAYVGIINKNNSKNKENIVRLIGLGVFTAVCYTVFVLVPSDKPHLAALMNGLYFIGTDWLALTLLIFVADYTRIHPTAKIARILMFAYAGIDSLSLVVNTFTRHIFDVEYQIVNLIGYWQVQYTPLQPLHLLFVYLTTTYCIVLLAYRLLQHQKFIRASMEWFCFLL